MNKYICSLLIVFSLIICAAYSAEPELIEAGLPNQAVTFDRLLSQRDVTMTNSNVCTPLNNTATNTTALSYLDETKIEFPCKLRIFNPSTASITYGINTINSTGAVRPSGSARLLDKNGNAVVSNKDWEIILYRMPNLCFGSNGNATFTFEVWGMKGNR